MSDSLRSHGLQHSRLPCPSPTAGACSNSHPLGQWCHPTISSSVIPFSSCLHFFPASGSFPKCQFFASGGWSIGVSAPASVHSMNIQGWFPLGLTGLISWQFKGLSRVFSNTKFKSIYSSVYTLYMILYIVSVQSVQSLSSVRLFATPWIAAHQASLSITISRSSLRLMSIESVMPSSHLILGHPLLLLPPVPLSIRVFSNESTLCMRWPKYWSFSFSFIPSKEIPGLISFRIDWQKSEKSII